MEEEENGVGGERSGKLLSLIEKATTSTDPDVDPLLLKAIKAHVRYSHSDLRLAAHTLLHNMKRPHSQIRYLSLLIIDHLFMRSALFRTIISDHLDHLLSLSIGFRRNQSLPAPPSVASLLRSKAIEFLEKWNHSFGLHYRHLRLGYDYLKNNLKLHFPNRRESEREVVRERELRTQNLLRHKFQSLKDNLPSIMEEINSTLDEIMRCLKIARENDEGDLSMEPLDDDEEEEGSHVFYNPELRQIRLDSLMEGEKVYENCDNKAVFDVLRELYKLLVTKHMVTLRQCLSLLTRVEVDDTRFRDSTLKDFIDLRNKVLAAKTKCEESRCALPDMTVNGEDDDVIWEEAKVESTEPERNVKPTSTSKVVVPTELVPECSNARVNNVKTGEDRQHDSDPNSLRSKLLGEAPVVKWGSSMDNWGGNKDVLANHRGLELDSHWGRVDYDAVIPAEKIAQLNVQATIYKEEQAEIQPCRAPLRKGGLCARKDLKVCPFHGPIVLRDDEGKPILPLDSDGPPSGSLNVERKSMSPTPSMEEVDLDDESALAQQVAKQAVKNVRERDKEDAKKKGIDKRAVKRAKLAEVREHNEMVLREAAMTSTSRSACIGEFEGGSSSDRTSGKSKKPTLASMLRKKVTTKDRLAQKLLNSRARDSTIKQLSLGEDANYRESFPNQW